MFFAKVVNKQGSVRYGVQKSTKYQSVVELMISDPVEIDASSFFNGIGKAILKSVLIEALFITQVNSGDI